MIRVLFGLVKNLRVRHFQKISDTEVQILSFPIQEAIRHPNTIVPLSSSSSDVLLLLSWCLIVMNLHFGISTRSSVLGRIDYLQRNHRT